MQCVEKWDQIPLQLNNIELIYVAVLVQNAVLITQFTSNFPLIESLVLLSQLHKFHKVKNEQTSIEFDG